MKPRTCHKTIEELSGYPLTSHALILCALAALSFLIAGCAPKEPQVQFDAGLYKQILDRQKAGLAVEEDALTKLPEMSVAEYESLGDRYAQQGNWALSLLQYDNALKADPTQTRVRYKLGLLLFKQGLANEAYNRFHEILDYDLKFALAYEGMGQAHLQMGNDEAAEQELRQALTLDPKLWKSHNLLGILYDRQKWHHKAVAEYKAGLALQPGEPALHNNLGMAYYLSGQYEEAIRAFQQALLSGTGESKIYNNLGLAYAKLKRYREALEAFKKATDEARAYNNLGLIYLGSGKPRHANACFEKAVATHPRYYVKANENLALAQQALANDSSAQGADGEKSAATCP